MSDYRTIVVPYDFSDHARAALEVAVDLGRRFSADLNLIHVVQIPELTYGGAGLGVATPLPPPIDLSELCKGAMSSLRQVIDEINYPGKVEPHVVESINVAAKLRESAEDLGADLIIMGTHGRTGVAHAFLGSVTERTLRQATCPVLTVRA